MDRLQPHPDAVTVHPSATVDADVAIGARTKIWHYCHISSGAKIGTDCVLGQNVYVASTARIGNGVKIQNNVSIYDGVVLEDEVFCGPSMVFTNVINPRAFVERKTEYQRTLVQRGATLGANCTIICGNTIGAYAMVGAGAVVTKSVAPYAVMVGIPAAFAGWICRCGERITTSFAWSSSCTACGARYFFNIANQELEPHA